MALAATGGVSFSLRLDRVEEVLEFCRVLAHSTMVPEGDHGNVGNILAKIQYGAEIGLPPMQAVQKLFMEGGKIGVEVTTLLGLVKASGELEFVKRDWNAEAKKATVTLKRVGQPEVNYSWDQADTDRAGLSENEGHKKYPQRLFMHRALGFGLQDEFPDICAGLATFDQLEDAGVKAQPPVAATTGDELATEREAARVRDAIAAEFRRLDTSPADAMVLRAKHKGREHDLLIALQATPSRRLEPKTEAGPVLSVESQSVRVRDTSETYEEVDAVAVAKELGAQPAAVVPPVATKANRRTSTKITRKPQEAVNGSV